MTTYFIQAFIFLVAAVALVPLAKRLGLGSVLGYLIAGVLIGPIIKMMGHGADSISSIQHFAEFGVVMMLFLVGLELEPKSLWAMRHRLLGLGGLQVIITAALVTAIASLLGLQFSVALAIGLIFSLSSTAIVLQSLQEKGLSKTEGGQSAFSVLLFQDIAVIPMLALMPLLALPELTQMADGLAHADDHHKQISLVAGLPGWATALVLVSAVAGVVVGGHYLSRPLFRYVSDGASREVFTATALMLVIGIAALMSLVGLSPALGTFLAGVVLANSEFRHELESDIEPFKGLLLGLFFITVGAGIDFSVLANKFLLIIGLTVGLIALKALVLFALALVFRIYYGNRWLFSLSLAQAGEFGFVLLSFAVAQHVLPGELAQLLSLVVGLSMFLTPLLFIAYEKLIAPRFQSQENQGQPDTIDEPGAVIIAGMGRFGQVVNRMLVANGIATVAMDQNARQIDLMRRIKVKSYFGDASRPDLLHSAGIDSASAIVVALDDRGRGLELVKHVKHNHPDVKVLARAFDRGHYYELCDAGADFVISETYHSAVELAGQALIDLGTHPFRAEQSKMDFIDTEYHNAEKLYQSWKHEGETGVFDEHYRGLFIKMQEELFLMFNRERGRKHSVNERGWTPPPKNYTEDLGDDTKPD